MSSVESNARAPAASSRGRFHRQGEGEGEPMLCVHGITDTWRTWELVMPALAECHDVLAITLLGHSGGRAPGPSGDVTLKELVDEAERDMDGAGFETAHIVGNSLGGWVALELAARGRARSVVALCPAGGWDVGNRRALGTYWNLIATQSFLKLGEPIAVNLAARPRGRRLVLGNLVSDPPSVSASLATALVRGAADCPGALPLLAESRRDGYPDLEEIGCPVRIAWGTKDRLLPVKALSERLHRILPEAEWVDIEGAGHMPQIDHPELTTELILEISTAAHA